MPAREASCRGIVLILVAGLLSMLTLVAASFVRLRQVGRSGAGGQIVDARAGLLARSGVEYATARLTQDLPAPRIRTRANARDDWTCRDAAGTLLARLHNPSWAHGEPYADGSPADGRYGTEVGSPDAFDTSAHDLDGDRVHTPWTGRLRGTMQAHGDLFVVRVTSEEGKLYVNGGYLDGGDRPDPTVNGTPDHRDIAAGYNATLQRVLNRLGVQPEVGIPDLGDRVIGNRPLGGYVSLTDLNARAGISKDLSAYLTCHAWVDRSVIRPQGGRAPVPTYYAALADVKVARGAMTLEPCGRAPVNVNEAPREVIQACLDGLDAAVVQEATIADRPTRTMWMSVSTPTAETIAREIVRSRGEGEDADGDGALDPGEDADGDGILDARFVSWGQLRAYLESLVRAEVFVVPNYAGDVVDLILANANPNSDLSKNTPDRILWRRADKSDLRTGSTEFSLHPLAGIRRVESLGRIRVAGEGEAAVASRGTLLRLYVPIRHTTQRDFVGGRAAPSEYVSAAIAGPPMPPGAATCGAARGWGGAPGVGPALLTYPEPVPCLPAGASDLDGQIALATMEPSVPAGAMFMHRFAGSWTADVGGGLSPIPSPDCDGRQADAMLQTDPAVPTWDPARPGTLLPDGAHAQDGRVAMYATQGNVPSFHGVLVYWLKESHLRPCQAPIDVCIGGPRAATHSVSRWLATSGGGLLAENGPGKYEIGPPTLTHERSSEVHPADVQDETVFCNRWGLVTAGWDLDHTVVDPGVQGGQAWFRLDGAHGTNAGREAGSYCPYNWAPGASPMDGPDRRIGVGCLVPTPLHTAGDRLAMIWRMGSNAVIDEMAILDLGGDADAARLAGQAMAAERFQEGRYYKGNDGMFTSVDLPRGPGGAPVRVARVYWTEWLPRTTTWYTKPSICSSNTYWTALPPDPRLEASHTAVQIVAGPPGGETVVHEASVEALGGYPGASRVGATFAGPWRYRVLFRPTPGWTAAQYLDTPVLETPFLDDVTILTVPAGGPIRLAWSE